MKALIEQSFAIRNHRGTETRRKPEYASRKELRNRDTEKHGERRILLRDFSVSPWLDFIVS